MASSRPGWPWGPLDRDMARLVRQGYYSAVTYMDRQVEADEILQTALQAAGREAAGGGGLLHPGAAGG